MSHEYITWRDAEERQRIKGVFERVSGFPGIVGCVDGSHIYITAPVEDAVHYRNRYQSYSMNVQAVVDNNLLVRHLHLVKNRKGERASNSSPCLRKENLRKMSMDAGRLLAEQW
ncbi:hypothetical protein FOCC_FOCC015664 [Frankliniella occidentalis]|nr:hypothetical protein FOCC_FOCC015664 [Frankliniella occidentalis]